MPSRREVLRYGVLAGTAAVVSATAAARPAIAQPQAKLRRDVSVMELDDPVLVSYRRAVSRMQALAASDPRSWSAQAGIHDRFCPHNNWYFLPWHRAYLAAFEAIIAEQAQDPSFALPYWDWTANPRLPEAFTVQSVGGAPNPLRHPNRRRGVERQTLPDEFVGSEVIRSILSLNQFDDFGSTRPDGQSTLDETWVRAPGQTGTLEGTPHNSVHGWIGGDMGTFVSPLDPIFWLHHNNIDRLWESWNGIGNPNSSDPLWRDMTFTANFVRPDGQPLDTRVSAQESIQALGYRFDRLAGEQAVASARSMAAPSRPAPATAAAVMRASAPVTQAIEVGKALRVDVPLSAPGNVGGPVAAGEGLTSAPRVEAVLRNVKAPIKPGVQVRVFLNNPDATADTPSTDPSFAGTIAFFGGPAAHAGHGGPAPAGHAGHGGAAGAAGKAAGPSFVVDITGAVERMRRRGMALGSTVSLKLVPTQADRSEAADGTAFTLESVEIRAR